MRQTILTCLACICGVGFFAGCQTRLDMPFVDNDIFVSTQVTGGTEIIAWEPQFSDEQRYIPVHPDDPGLGGVTLELDGVTAGTRLGFSGMLGTKYIRFVAGAAGRYNPNSDDEHDVDDYDGDGDVSPLDLELSGSGMKDLKKQPGNSSYGYGWVETTDYTLMPYVGLEGDLPGGVIWGFNYGMPRTKFRFEKGHYRNQAFETIERDTWVDFGQAFSGKIGYRILENHGTIGLQYMNEYYEAEFSGVDTDIYAHVFSILFEFRF